LALAAARTAAARREQKLDGGFQILFKRMTSNDRLYCRKEQQAARELLPPSIVL